MDFDFTPFFKKYEAVSIAADAVFARVKKEYADCVKCETKCADCCHALFDLSLIEALYINHQFNRVLSGAQKSVLLEKANRIDRKVYQIKKKAHKDFENGKNEVEILNEMALERVRCPLLNETDHCDLYEYRPITCRLYGIPTSINGMGHTCGLSGFVEGTSYPTVKMENIHQKLFEISSGLVNSLKTKYSRMADMLVPMSMALLTDYDDTTLGIQSDASPDNIVKGTEHDEKLP